MLFSCFRGITCSSSKLVFGECTCVSWTDWQTILYKNLWWRCFHSRQKVAHRAPFNMIAEKIDIWGILFVTLRLSMGSFIRLYGMYRSHMLQITCELLSSRIKIVKLDLQWSHYKFSVCFEDRNRDLLKKLACMYQFAVGRFKRNYAFKCCVCNVSRNKM